MISYAAPPVPCRASSLGSPLCGLLGFTPPAVAEVQFARALQLGSSFRPQLTMPPASVACLHSPSTQYFSFIPLDMRLVSVTSSRRWGVSSFCSQEYS